MLEFVANEKVPLPYRVIDPRSGEVLKQGVRASEGERISAEGGGARVYICYAGWAKFIRNELDKKKKTTSNGGLLFCFSPIRFHS